MKNSYQEDLDLNELGLLAQLTITVSKNEEFAFGCDWDSSDDGIKAMSSIFYGIGYDELTEQILNQLKEQCVIEGNGDEFLTIVNLLKELISSRNENASSESLAVSPRGVLKL